jgi:hypothetical protein
MRPTIPGQPTGTQSFLGWNFLFFVSERDWNGLVYGKAEVHGPDGLRCTFNAIRRSTRSAVEDQLREECFAWATEEGIRSL